MCLQHLRAAVLVLACLVGACATTAVNIRDREQSTAFESTKPPLEAAICVASNANALYDTYGIRMGADMAQKEGVTQITVKSTAPVFGELAAVVDVAARPGGSTLKVWALGLWGRAERARKIVEGC